DLLAVVDLEIDRERVPSLFRKVDRTDPADDDTTLIDVGVGEDAAGGRQLELHRERPLERVHADVARADVGDSDDGDDGEQRQLDLRPEADHWEPPMPTSRRARSDRPAGIEAPRAPGLPTGLVTVPATGHCSVPPESSWISCAWAGPSVAASCAGV